MAKRSTIVKLAYYPALFFSAIGLSLGHHVGWLGVGLNEILLVLSILLLVVVVFAMQLSGEFHTQAFWWLILGVSFSLTRMYSIYNIKAQ